jgi:hypothetical protein
MCVHSKSFSMSILCNFQCRTKTLNQTKHELCWCNLQKTVNQTWAILILANWDQTTKHALHCNCCLPIQATFNLHLDLNRALLIPITKQMVYVSKKNPGPLFYPVYTLKLKSKNNKLPQMTFTGANCL